MPVISALGRSVLGYPWVCVGLQQPRLETLFQNINIKSTVTGTEETAQELRAFIALSGGLGSVPRTHIAGLQLLWLQFQGLKHPLWPLQVPGIHWYTYIHADQIFINRK